MTWRALSGRRQTARPRAERVVRRGRRLPQPPRAPNSPGRSACSPTRGASTPTRQTPRVTSPAALPSGSAGTAPPAISSSTTSRITPRCTSGNRQAGQAGPWGTWPGGSASRHNDHQDHPYNCGSGAVFPYDRATCSAGPAFTVVRPASRQPARLCTGMTSGVPGSIPTLCRTGISTGP
jgi:hypothetical protein